MRKLLAGGSDVNAADSVRRFAALQYCSTAQCRCFRGHKLSLLTLYPCSLAQLLCIWRCTKDTRLLLYYCWKPMPAQT